MGTVSLALARVRTDGGTQSRADLHPDVVAEYAELVSAGTKLPPIIVYHDGEDHWLADGFHRVAAMREAGKDLIFAEVRQGVREDAVWASCGANQDHGLRRTNADKRRAVEMALRHPKSEGMSDRAIAEHCGVGRTLVGQMRASATGRSGQSATRTGADGRTYDTSGIAESNRRRAESTRRNPPAPRQRIDTSDAQDVPQEDVYEPPEEPHSDVAPAPLPQSSRSAPEPLPVLDANEVEIPEALRETWDWLEGVALEADTALDATRRRLRSEVKEAQRRADARPGPRGIRYHAAKADLEGALKDLDQAIAVVRGKVIPHVVCARCAGLCEVKGDLHGCKTCGGRGWLGKWAEKRRAQAAEVLDSRRSA